MKKKGAETAKPKRPIVNASVGQANYEWLKRLADGDDETLSRNTRKAVTLYRKIHEAGGIEEIERKLARLEELTAKTEPLEPETEGWIESLKLMEAADPSLPDALVELGSVARTRPPLARVLKELAAAVLGGEPGGTDGRSRTDRHQPKTSGRG